MIAPPGPCKTGSMSSPLHCLVTGATGYIGGRLVPELLSAGYAVRCLARAGQAARPPVGGRRRDRGADVLDGSAVRRALEGVDVAYYLVHSLGTDATSNSATAPRRTTFAAAAPPRACGASSTWAASSRAGRRQLSPHLRSRAEVGEILLAAGVPTAVLQAAVIIGSGSASFEMLRYLDRARCR